MRTFRRYLVIQGITLVCGIVGPIFLFVFFGAGALPELKWMYFAGLIITAVDVLAALLITDALCRRERDDHI
jgi:membrane protein implicated in regulation of membrane protease activity